MTKEMGSELELPKTWYEPELDNAGTDIPRGLTIPPLQRRSSEVSS